MASISDSALPLRGLREARGSMSQRELARRLDVHYTTVNRWERGRAGISLAALAKCAEVLGVSESELIHGEAGG